MLQPLSSSMWSGSARSVPYEELRLPYHGFPFRLFWPQTGAILR